MQSNLGYLFLELFAIVYAAGFGWEFWQPRVLFSPIIISTVVGLALLWFVLDQIALHFGLWTFPNGGTLPVRIFSLPVEEYLLFFLHSLACFLFVQQYARARP